jgi:hypothetical protein
MVDQAVIKRVLARIEKRGHGDGRHSDAYRLLREQHAAVVARFQSNWPGWDAVALEMSEAGVVGKGGRRLSASSVRRVWKRVCADVAKAQAIDATRKPIGGKFPSRISPDWRPQVVLPHAPLNPAVAGTSVGASAPASDAAMPDFPTVDPSGAPLAEGHVFYRGRSLPRRAAENLVEIARQGMEIDRYK